MRGIFMKNRMTWEEIQNSYPNSWVKLEDADVNPDNEMDIRSAIVVKVGEPTTEDLIDYGAGRSIEIFTTPDGQGNLNVGALTV